MEKLCDERFLLKKMQKLSCDAVQQFTWNAYGDRWEKIIKTSLQ